ncbi:MAG: OB-fold nucleic acid binding domain-containing protein, partial [Anaerovoracaceae bacterium]
MTSVMGDVNSISKYMRNCTEMGIEVLPPDVNESYKKFSVSDGKIRFGLLGVKNVGENVIDAIVEARESKGKPSDIFQFIENLDIHKINKKAIESLIRAGAMDCLNENRAAHIGIYESLIESAQNSARRNVEGQISLFQTNAETMEESSAGNVLPDVKNFERDILMAQEKEMLGVYLTDHPLKEYKSEIERISTVNAQDLADVLDSEEQGEQHDFVRDGMKAVMAGIITGKKTLLTKNNKMMAFVNLEDLYGSVEVVVFPNVYERFGSIVKEDAIVSISGSLNFKEGEIPKLLAEKIADLKNINEINKEPPKGIPEGIVKIKLPETEEGEGIILSKIKSVM